VSVSYDGNLLAAVNNKGRVYVWREEESLDFGYTPISKVQAHKGYVTKCTFSPNGEYLATASADQTVALWQFASSHRPAEKHSSPESGPRDDDEERWTRIEDEDEDDGASYNSSFEGDSDMSLAEDRLLLRHSFEGHLKWVWDCSFSADSAYIVSASSDCTARLWSVSSGECICIYTGHLKALTSVALNDIAF